MKKLIVSVVALTAAIIAKGASVDWSFDGSYDSPETYNYTMYWLDSADGASTYAAALAGGTYESAAAFTAAIAGNKVSGPIAIDEYGSAAGAFTGVDGTEVYSALILQSTAEGANIFYYDDLALAGLTYSAGQPAPGSLDIFNDDAGYTSGGVIKYTAGGGGGGDIPEPTSGLLLALGGAMLALRRRRA